MLAGAAVCPHPPLLVPAATGSLDGRPAHHAAPPGQPGPASQAVDAQLSELRAACHAAVADLAAAGPELLVVVGGAGWTHTLAGSAAGSLHGFGVPFGTGTGPAVLPLSLTIGAWLVRALPAAPPRLLFQAVDQSWPAAECLRLGARLTGHRSRVALLAMGDGPARPAIRVPGAPDPQADAYTAEVAAALAAADPGRLAGISPAADAELLVAGRAAWQVLAGAAAAPGGARLTGSLRYAAAPLGVSYLVAVWTATGDPSKARSHD